MSKSHYNITRKTVLLLSCVLFMYIPYIYFSTVLYTSSLDCFISCATNYKNALVLGWMEKAKTTMRTYVLVPYLGLLLSFYKVCMTINAVLLSCTCLCSFNLSSSNFVYKEQCIQ